MKDAKEISDFGGKANAGSSDSKEAGRDIVQEAEPDKRAVIEQDAVPDSVAEIVSGKFSEENICGEGASCIVYRMRLGGLLVAVKRLRPEFRFYPAYMASYRKEFAIGQRLKHDALPVYRELKSDFNDVYIIMDYVDGVSIEDFIKSDEGKKYFQSADNTRTFFTQLLEVTGYLHRSGVIHCDLKPANVMLRNIDRAVMLLDFDKAYCDILDNTHGGTKGSSAPLQAGEKPTAIKDLTAIGRIFDKLADTIPGFPASKFRKFRKECDNPEATAELLLECLQPKSHSSVRIILGVAAIAVTFAIIFFMMFRKSQPADNYIPTTDTIVNIINMPSQTNESPNPSVIDENKDSGAKESKAITVDFDAEMSDFIAYAKKEQKRLSMGVMSDKEISAMAQSLSERYLDAYSRIVKTAKRNQPDISAMDIELAIASASERSRASSLHKEIMQAAVDTLKRRNPELY